MAKLSAKAHCSLISPTFDVQRSASDVRCSPAPPQFPQIPKIICRISAEGGNPTNDFWDLRELGRGRGTSNIGRRTLNIEGGRNKTAVGFSREFCHYGERIR